MNTGAIITMVLVQATVTIVTVYFFIKVWRTPPKPDPEGTDEKPDQ